MSGPRREHHEANRLSWNTATVAHNSHKGDQAAFFRDGGTRLYPEERELLGNLAGLRVVHLQCNSGQDTLSLARLGAEVTGVDISDEAIAFAQQLSKESGIEARFERADVFDWLEAAASRGEQFDVAFSSYGALVWLSDLSSWARDIAAILRPGGRLVLVEGHPTSHMLDDSYQLAWPYSSRGEPISEPLGVGDYVGLSGAALGAIDEGVVDFENPHPAVEFNWGIADIVGAVLDAGLRLTAFREYDYSNGWRQFPDMRPLPGNRWALRDGLPSFPLLFGLVAESDSRL